MIYVGIDNGLSGGLVALSETPSLPPIEKLTMPTQAKAGGGIGHELSVVRVHQFLSGLAPRENVCLAIEIPGKHSPGVKALCSMWDSFGRLCALVEIKGYRHHLVSPNTWQRAMIPHTRKGDTKPAALTLARRLWPGESWIPTARATQPHSGLVDAALIAEWARRARL